MAGLQWWPYHHAGPYQGPHAKWAFSQALTFAVGPTNTAGMRAGSSPNPSQFSCIGATPNFHVCIHLLQPLPSCCRGDAGNEAPTAGVHPWRNTAMGIPPKLGSGTPKSAPAGMRWAPTLAAASTGGSKAIVPRVVAVAGRILSPLRLQPSAMGGRKLPRRRRAK